MATNYSIQKLKSTDNHLIDDICELLKDNYDPAISKYFVYNDQAYKSFLASNLLRTDQFIYYIGFNKTIIGFAQFKIVANTLFLINLIVRKNYQNNKLGSRLLNYGIIAASTSAPHINVFELNAFVSNTILNWYLRLGMKLVNIDYWYDLTKLNLDIDLENQNNNLLEFKYISDQFGFTQLFLINTPVGYLINSKKLVIKGNFPFAYLSKIPLVLHDQEIQLSCIVSNVILDFPLIDRSYVLRIQIPDLQFVNDHLSMNNN